MKISDKFEKNEHAMLVTSKLFKRVFFCSVSETYSRRAVFRSSEYECRSFLSGISKTITSCILNLILTLFLSRLKSFFGGNVVSNS